MHKSAFFLHSKDIADLGAVSMCQNNIITLSDYLCDLPAGFIDLFLLFFGISSFRIQDCISTYRYYYEAHSFSLIDNLVFLLFVPFMPVFSAFFHRSLKCS